MGLVVVEGFEVLLVHVLVVKGVRLRLDCDGAL